MTTITRVRGDTYVDTITVTDLDTGLPLNIAGYSFIMTIDPNKSPNSSTSNLYSLTGVIISAAAGTVYFGPSPTQANQVPGTYFYEVQMTDAGGLKRTIASGKYTFVQDICKS